jgi:hypothetical protein
MNRSSVLLLLAFGAATAFGMALPAVAAAHDPIDWARKYEADNKELFWRYGGAYPGWVTADVADSLGVDWSDPDTHNSRAPFFTFSAAGAGRVYYSASMTSPCSGGAVWLACAKDGGTTGWDVYIRNLDGAPYGSWAWYDQTGECATGDLCFRLQRSLIHEPIHLTFGTNHSSQDQADTVFTANQPSYANEGGKTFLLRRCDQAASQLAYDLRDMAGPYGDCFDHIANAGAGGLRTDLTVSDASIAACQGTAATVTGRLQVRDYSAYRELGGNPLAGRVVRFDLGSSANVASTVAIKAAAPAANWSKSFTSATYGTRTYVAHFDTASGSGLASSSDVTFTITWIPATLC